MGFFASELYSVLEAHNSTDGNPWTVLSRMGIHPQQVDRLKKAFDDPGQIATLHESFVDQIKSTLNINTNEWSRISAALEADLILRLLLYHNYELYRALNIANAVFSSTFRDLMIANGDIHHVYLTREEDDHTQSQLESRTRKRPGRKRVFSEDIIKQPTTK